MLLTKQFVFQIHLSFSLLKIKKGEQYTIVLSLDKCLLLYSFFRCANDIYTYIYFYVGFHHLFDLKITFIHKNKMLVKVA